jgi:hypothetical protein
MKARSAQSSRTRQRARSWASRGSRGGRAGAPPGRGGSPWNRRWRGPRRPAPGPQALPRGLQRGGAVARGDVLHLVGSFFTASATRTLMQLWLKGSGSASWADSTQGAPPGCVTRPGASSAMAATWPPGYDGEPQARPETMFHPPAPPSGAQRAAVVSASRGGLLPDVDHAVLLLAPAEADEVRAARVAEGEDRAPAPPREGEGHGADGLDGLQWAVLAGPSVDAMARR